MTWVEKEHPRIPGHHKGGGEFTGKHDWAKQLSDALGDDSGGLDAAIRSGVRDEQLLAGGHSDARVDRITYNNGTVAIRKRFVKNWQGFDAKRQADAEQLAAALGSAIGVRTPSVARTGEAEITASFVRGTSGYAEIERRYRFQDWKAFAKDLKTNPTDDELRLGVFDILTSNNDRANPGNWFVDEQGNLVGIDHAGTFNRDQYGPGNDPFGRPLPDHLGAPGPFAGSFISGFQRPKYASNKLSKADAAWLRQQLDSVRPQFQQAGRGDWWQGASARLDAIGAKARGKTNVFPQAASVEAPKPAKTTRPRVTKPAAGTAAARKRAGSVAVGDHIVDAGGKTRRVGYVDKVSGGRKATQYQYFDQDGSLIRTRHGEGATGTAYVELADAPPPAKTGGDWVQKVADQIEQKAPPPTPPRPYAGPRYEVPDGVPQDLLDQIREAVRQQDTTKARDLTIRLGHSDALTTLKQRLYQEGDVLRALDVWRKEHGVAGTDREVQQDLARQAREAFAGKKIAVRMTPAGLSKALIDGRIKTQFETNRSNGLKDPEVRARAEAAWYGIGQDLPIRQQVAYQPQRRPVSGYVMLDGVRPAGTGTADIFGVSTDALSQYGRIQVVLKDHVRERTTAMFGDTLNNRHNGMPSPVDNPSWMSFSPAWKSMVTQGLAGATRDPMSQEFRRAQYAEAHIHGGVGVGDIAEVVFPSTPTAAQRAQLDQAGIPWRVHDFKAAAKSPDLSERQVALQIAEQDHAYLLGEIADNQKSTVDAAKRGDKYTVDLNSKELKLMQTQLKAIAAALPALRAAVKGGQ